MKKTRFLLVFLIVPMLTLFTAGKVGATLIGPGWPAPGGTTYSGTGEVGYTGGITYTYDGFDFAAFTALYWGPWSATSSAISLDGPINIGEQLIFSSSAGNIAEWYGQSLFEYFYTPTNDFRTESITTRLTIKVSDLFSNPIDWLNTTPYGSANDVVVEVKGAYKVNLLMEADFPNDGGNNTGGWMPVRLGFDAYDNGPGHWLDITTSNGFYYEPVPEPSTMILFGSGLVGFAVSFIKRTRKNH